MARRALTDRTNSGAILKQPALKAVKPSASELAPTLPEGWTAEASTASGRAFYRNNVTGEVQWEVPSKPAIAASQAIGQACETAIAELSALGVRVLPYGLGCTPPIM